MIQIFLSSFLVLSLGAAGVSGYAMFDRSHTSHGPNRPGRETMRPDMHVPPTDSSTLPVATAEAPTEPAAPPQVLSAQSTDEDVAQEIIPQETGSSGAPPEQPAPQEEAPQSVEPEIPVTLAIDPDRCAAEDMIPGLAQGKSNGLTELAAIQDICQSSAISGLMIFADIPTLASAKSTAQGLATTLKEYYHFGITPIVVIEPSSAGKLIKLTDITAGKRDKQLDALFRELRWAGVTDEMIGTWVPYPEINTPAWDARGWKPEQFPGMVSRFFAIMRKHYPDVRGSVLLNAMSYDPSDTDWSNGQHASFAPYMKGFPAGTIQSFGLQGFPWKPPKSKSAQTPLLEAAEMLPSSLASSAAEMANVHDIWFNTGTFGSKYSGREQVELSADDRERILTGILADASGLKHKGYEVSINIFAEDKTDTDENTDWSYGNLSDPANRLRNTIKKFASTARRDDISLSFFFR